jgi:hypothetical protein
VFLSFIIRLSIHPVRLVISFKKVRAFVVFVVSRVIVITQYIYSFSPLGGALHLPRCSNSLGMVLCGPSPHL